MKLKYLLVAVCFGLLSCGRSADGVLENDDIRLVFSKENGSLISLYNVREGVEHLDSAKAVLQPLWEFEYMPGSDIKAELPTEVSFKRKGNSCLQILWRQKGGASGVEVKATVRLKKDRPSLSEWYIEADGLDNCEVMDIKFPLVGGIRPLGGNDNLAIGTYTGRLYKNPWSKASEEKPYQVSRATGYQALQFNALYNPDYDGIYWGTEDPDAWNKTFNVEILPDNAKVFLKHFLRRDLDASSFSAPYPSIVGVFKGDWMDAADLYAQWGLKQWWCKESRLKKGLVPDWVLKTGLWEWNRGRSDNVLTEAVALQKHIGLPVSVFWHWWHGCSYDDGFPDYLPPREGRESFIEAVAAARKEGVHCLNYMNSKQWGDSAPSWNEKQAYKWCLRTADGGTRSHVYNIFTGKSLTNMCPSTEFWRKTYTDMCDTLVNVYGTGGIYLDQSCQATPCYSATHGHPIGGGNSFVKGHLQLFDDIREATSSYPYDAPALSGEYASEYWMGHLDIGLPLQAGQERMSGGKSTSEVIPIFPYVYHEYQVCYGNFSMLVTPPYDEKWPQEFCPADTETPLPDEFDRQFMMEQAKSFIWGIQPCIANFHEFLFEKKPQAMAFLEDMVKTRYKALDYLLYGDMVRGPEFPVYQETIPICGLNTYSKGEGRLRSSSKLVSTLYSSTWKAQDGSLGIAIANISDETREFEFSLVPSTYGLPSKGEIELISANAEPYTVMSYDGETSVPVSIPARSTMVLSVK